MPNTKRPLTRIARFVSMMRENRYPNYPKLLAELRKLDAAGTFNFSQKTLQRDVDYLKVEHGAPIEYDYARRGYYLTNPEWTWEWPSLDPEEMKASLLGARLAETILPEPLRGEIRKAVDSQLMSNEKGLAEGVELEAMVASVTPRGKIPPEIFGAVFKAWEERRTLRLEYVPIGEEASKDFTVEPHVLALFDGRWYIKGKLIKKGNWDCAEWGYPDTILALSRIKRAEILDTTFETDLDMVAEVASGKLFDMEEVRDVELKIDGLSAAYVREEFPEEDITYNGDGSITLRIGTAIRCTLVKWILGGGGDVVALSPESLAAEIAERAERLAKKQKEALRK